MIAYGSFLLFLLHFYKSASIQPQHKFEQQFRHNTPIETSYSNTTILILENGPYSEILPKLVKRSHYLFVKQPSMICMKSLEQLANKLPKCSIYTNLHFNAMPRAANTLQWPVQRAAIPRGLANPTKPVSVRIGVCNSTL